MDERSLRLGTEPPADDRETPPALRADSYRRLAGVFHDVLSEQSLEPLLERIADTVSDLIPYDALTIYRADETAQRLVPVVARDRYASEVMGHPMAFDEGITGWAVQRREAVLVAQAQEDPRSALIPGTEDEPEALIAIPLVARGRLMGALNLYRIGEHASFSNEELELADRFGDAAALALDNAEIRARLELQAKTDSLTGLFNHRYFHERLRSELALASRGQRTLAVLMLDMDDFKRVNDIHGHAAGDQALAAVAEALSRTVREGDVVCRIGGEEFGIIAPGLDLAGARALAARLAGRVRAARHEHGGPLGASIGIAHAPTHAMNSRELAGCAEAAMMTAKAARKGRIVIFGEESEQRPDRDSAARDLRSIAHLKMLQSLVGKLNRLKDVREIGTTIVEELRTLVDYHSGRVYLRDGDRLVPVAFRGDREETAEALECRVGEGITGRVALTGASLLVPNALECDFAVPIPGTPDIEESIAAVPLRYGERVIGAIVISTLGVDQFDDADVRLLEVLAGHASVALENARLYERSRREAERARESAAIASALLELSSTLAAAESLNDVLRLLVNSTARILGTSRATIWAQDEAGGPLRPEHGSAPELDVPDEPLPAAEARILAEPDDLVVASFPPGRSWAEPCAIVYLRLDAGRMGLLAVPVEDGLDERRRRLLLGIADQATLAIGNARNFESLERTFLSTVEALANALEANDACTRSHARSLTDTALEVGRSLGLAAPDLKRLELGALFHDIGKIGVSSEILAKPGPLTRAERAEIELHPTLGERILAPIERLAEVRPIVRHCHERWDGQGYPDGLAGEKIPLESRIIFVCDAYHAMTTDRPYRTRLSPHEALERIRSATGSQFDPRVVDAFLGLRQDARAPLLGACGGASV